MRLKRDLTRWAGLLMIFSSATLAAEAPVIKRLINPATQMQALAELERKDKEQSLEDFAAEHENLRVTKCPQRKAGAALYIVAHSPEWKNRRLPMPGEYVIPRPEELFAIKRPIARPSDDGTPQRLVSMVLGGYREDGKEFIPFEGSNMIDDGYLLDINGDGLVEKLDTDSMSVKGSSGQTVEVLQIVTAELNPQTLLAVVLNWHPHNADQRANRWTWDIVRGKNQEWRVVLFPSTGGAEQPGAVFEWDATTGRFTGPDGGKGKHFARLAEDRKGLWKGLEDLQQHGGLAYALAAKPAETRRMPGEADIPPPPTARPYVKQSRKALSHAELFKFMGPGLGIGDHEAKHRLQDRAPDDFWSQTPRAAALELADINRSAGHRSRFQLAVDDRDGGTPPAEGTLFLIHHSSSCYDARTWHFMISFRPGNSWLAYARAAVAGAAFYNSLHHGWSHEFEWRELKDADAKHLAQTIWWLDRVRSLDRQDDQNRSFMSSTGDGYAQLSVESGTKKPALNLAGTVFASSIGSRWNSSYEKETALNLACHLIERELPLRWGGSRDFIHETSAKAANEEKPDPGELEKRKQNARVMLERFVRMQKGGPLKPAFLELALKAAGNAGSSIDDVVKPLEAGMRPPGKVETRLRSLESRLKPKALHEDHFTGPSEEQMLASELRAELQDDVSFVLRETLPFVRRQLASRDDATALKTWASSRDPGADWAMRRLQELNPPAYVEALAAQLLAIPGDSSNPRDAVHLFEAISDADPAAAERLLPQLNQNVRKACEPYAMNITTAGTDVDSLLQTLMIPTTSYDAKKRAVELLVPAAEPMKHRDPRIDAALAILLNRSTGASYDPEGSLAATGLARRDGALAHWNAILLHYSKFPWGLDALDVPCRLAMKSNDPKVLGELQDMLQRHLKRTNSYLPGSFAAIYAADLRAVADDLSRVATFDSTDIEGREAAMSGGHIHPVVDRFHMARQILALWDEPDITTRARMLVAWRIHKTEAGAPAHSFLIEQMERQLKSAMTEASLDRTLFLEFIDWCLQSADGLRYQPMATKTKDWLQAVKGGFR